jgi:hypothetical protein
MSAQSEAARLHEISQSTYTQGLAQEIVNYLTSTLATIADALGPNHSKLNEALAPIQEAIQSAHELGVMLDGAFALVGDVGTSIA